MLFPTRSILFVLLACFQFAAAEKVIVVLKKGSLSAVLTQIIQSLQLANPLSPLAQFTIGTDFVGFNADLTADQIAKLQKNPNVAYVEADGVMHISGVIKRATLTQAPSSWGLGRISHHAKGVSQYIYDSSAGTGTCIYVLDTGIYLDHSEFSSSRATSVQNYVTTESADDLSGHGTAVAGAAGGNTYGVARNAKVLSIKVCDQSGNCDVSSVVAAISLAVNDGKTAGKCTAGTIINMSFGGPSAGWQSVKDAISTAAQQGAFVVASAGNDHVNAGTVLPASAAGACAVGATDSNDAIASFSNYGTSLAVFAPGVGIQTAGIGSVNAMATVDGTSMSAPYVAGLGAYLWGKTAKGTGAAGVALCNTIKSTAGANYITGSLNSSPNKLAYNGNGA